MHKYESLHASQLPRERFVLLAKFIITKYLKQKVDDDLSVCEDERSPDVMTFLSPMEKCTMDFCEGDSFTTEI